MEVLEKWVGCILLGGLLIGEVIGDGVYVKNNCVWGYGVGCGVFVGFGVDIVCFGVGG